MGGGKSISLEEILNDYLKSYYSQMPHHFIFTTSPKQFEHITKELIYIDMKELSSKNAYSTMQNVCSKIGIDGYKIASKEFFSKKMADSLALNLEKTIIFNNLAPFSIEVKILPFENTLHKKITKLIDDFKSKYLMDRKISLCLIGKNRKKALKILNKNPKTMESVINEVEKYLKTLKENFEIYDNSILDENDVIDFFRKNTELYNKFLKLFQYEISNIKQNAPHIVESWDFYNKFVEIG